MTTYDIIKNDYQTPRVGVKW